MRILLSLLVIACLSVAGCVKNTTADTWNTVVVDSSGNSGEYSSIAVDRNGNAHIVYFDYLRDDPIGDGNVPYGNLKYATNTGGNWQVATLHPGAGMLPRICIGENNTVHIIHSNLGVSNVSGLLDLLYTTNKSGSWETTRISSEVVKGADSSIAVDSKGNAHISTHNQEGAGVSSERPSSGLRYITNATGEWTWFDIDTNPSAGFDTDIAMDHDDNIHISYLDKNEGLKYATNVSGSWEVFTVDDEPNVGWNTSIVADSNNRVHISYSDPSPILDPPGHGYLKYATNQSGVWVTYVIDDDNAGAYTGIAIDDRDNLHIAYCTTDGNRGRLMYITNNSGSWVKEMADGEKQAVGTYCAIDVDSGGIPHISHYDYVNQNLRYSSRK